jgi:hypothetical protein
LVKYLQIFLITLISFSAVAQKNTNSLEFIENKGQWDNRVTFMGDLGNGSFFLRKTGFTITQRSSADMVKLAEFSHAKAETNPRSGGSGGGNENKLRKSSPDAPAISEVIVHSHAYNMELEGSNPSPVIEGGKLLPGYNNYFLGNDKSKWAGGCRIFSTVTYRDVYPNIDLRYFTDEGWVKYEFIVRPSSGMREQINYH